MLQRLKIRLRTLIMQVLKQNFKKDLKECRSWKNNWSSKEKNVSSEELKCWRTTKRLKIMLNKRRKLLQRSKRLTKLLKEQERMPKRLWSREQRDLSKDRNKKPRDNKSWTKEDKNWLHSLRNSKPKLKLTKLKPMKSGKLLRKCRPSSISTKHLSQMVQLIKDMSLNSLVASETEAREIFQTSTMALQQESLELTALLGLKN